MRAETANWRVDPNALRGRIAVVAGATRGAERGIATALGEAGATVICSGRSSRTHSLKSDYDDRPETIEETAELVTSLGGHGVPFVVDHLDAGQVMDLQTGFATGTVTSTSWSTTSGVRSCLKVGLPTGTSLFGKWISRKVCGFCAWRSTLT